MPVNDSPTVNDASINCALCCVAGIVNTTVETERQLVRNAAAIVGNLAADHVFLEYAFRLNLAPRSDSGKDTIRAQVLGVQHWLVHHHGFAVNAIASTDNPLGLGELRQQMDLSPIGTAYIVLILDWNDDFNQAFGGHWVVARRTATGYDYTDYQLDVAANNAGAMRQHVKRDNAPFGAPSVTNAPMEAFGDQSRSSNRFMALSVPQVVVAQGGGGGGGCCLHCYITTAACSAMGLPDDCDELTALRRYRDTVLLTTDRGAAEVEEYYATAPAIVAALNQRDDAGAIYRLLYDEHIRPAARAADSGDFGTAYRLFREGVERAARFAAGTLTLT